MDTNSTNYILLKGILQNFDKHIIDSVLVDMTRESANDKQNDRNRSYTTYNNQVGTKQKQKTYYQERKVGIKLKRQQRIDCDICGRDVRKDGLLIHKKSKRCLRDGRVIGMFVEQEKEKREAYNMGLEDKY